MPRDRYDCIVREKIGDYLKTVFDGRLSAYYPAFPEGGLARVHFIIGRSGGKTPKVDRRRSKRRSATSSAPGRTRCAKRRRRPAPTTALAGIAARFPESYRGCFSAAEALVDAARIAGIGADNPIAIDYYRHADQTPEQAALKIYHHGSAGGAVAARADAGKYRLPGDQRTHLRGRRGGRRQPSSSTTWSWRTPSAGRSISTDGGKLFEEVFLSVWHGDADNDGYNAWPRPPACGRAAIGILRAYGRYLQQAGIPQSQDFIAAALNRYPDIARGLFALFVARLDPAAARMATSPPST